MHCTFVITKKGEIITLGGTEATSGKLEDSSNSPVLGNNEELWAGTFQSDEPWPSVEGGVIASVDATGGIILVLQNDFESDAGPDFDLFLSSASNSIADSVLFDDLQGPEGSQAYTIPSSTNVKLADKPYVLVWPVSHSNLFGYARLTKQDQP